MALSEPSIKIWGINRKTKIVTPIIANHDMFQFCFIEKNRIDNFSRISSKTPSEQNELLSALFGIDAFNNFINNFTDNPDDRLKYTPCHIPKLDMAKEQLKNDINSKNDYLQQLEKIKEEQALLLKSCGYITIQQIKSFIKGNENEAGRKQIIQQELSSLNKKVLTESSITDLESGVTNFEQLYVRYQEIKQIYVSKKDKLQLRDLYDIVLKVQNQYPEKCPVCETPLVGEQTSLLHPYDNARAKLEELREIALLEMEYKKYQDDLMKCGATLITELQKWEQNSAIVNIDIGLDIPSELLQSNSRDIEKLVVAYSNFFSIVSMFYMDKYLAVAQQVKLYNSEVGNAQYKRDILQQEMDNLDNLLQKIKSIEDRQELMNDKLDKLNMLIDDFDKKNSDLIKNVNDEHMIIEERILYLEAYKALVKKLKTYRDGLFNSLVKDLNGLTKEFYNIMNQGDPSHELIEQIELPTASTSLIKIAFKDKPSEGVNALHVLSEGHIRCLGVAVLLAKAVSEQVPFIIFDDIINAIDTDHRAGIRKLLFTDERLLKHQYIISSHSGEFIKDIENSFKTNDRMKYIHRINFHNSGCRGVCLSEWSKHYLLLAGEMIEKDDLRGALTFCRQGLENITVYLWETLQKDRIINGLKVFLKNPTDKPELKTKVVQLRTEVEKKIKLGQGLKYAPCLKCLSTLEGTQNSCRNEWAYLNGGVHEELDIPDFERENVREIYRMLLQLEEFSKPTIQIANNEVAATLNSQVVAILRDNP